MGANMDFTNNFNDALDGISKKVQQATNELSGNTSYDTLFNKSFMSKHTQFTSFKDLLISGGYGYTKEAFKAIPDNEFDEFIDKSTDFSSWKEMYTAAAKQYSLSALKSKLL